MLADSRNVCSHVVKLIWTLCSVLMIGKSENSNLILSTLSEHWPIIPCFDLIGPIVFWPDGVSTVMNALNSPDRFPIWMDIKSMGPLIIDSVSDGTTDWLLVNVRVWGAVNRLANRSWPLSTLDCSRKYSGRDRRFNVRLHWHTKADIIVSQPMKHDSSTTLTIGRRGSLSTRETKRKWICSFFFTRFFFHENFASDHFAWQIHRWCSSLENIMLSDMNTHYTSQNTLLTTNFSNSTSNGSPITLVVAEVI